MYLKSLEIQGFKSFAKKVKLDFNSGITAIIGPNGSGKSNIADSIRWVLGEQSVKNLRGAKMEDVIFAGSSEHKAVGMAEVSLTLDNSTGIFPIPYTEITVTRRIFRSGESEYLLNKKHCRLKDVQELFNDTGLGKESFAIIGQGRVEEILNSKAEERRALIEEAAGIVRYRNRKKDAQKKLEDTEQCLVRILDIMSELGSNLDPLKNEAEKAKQYQKLKSEVDLLEINLAVRSIEIIEGRLKQIQSEVQKQYLSCQELEQSSNCNQEKLNVLKNQLEAMEANERQLQEDYYVLTEQLNQVENNRDVALERLFSITTQIDRAESELVQLQEKHFLLQNKFKVQASNHQNLQALVKTKEAELVQIEASTKQYELEFSELETDINRRKNEIIDFMQQIANHKNQLNQLTFKKNNEELSRQKNRQQYEMLQNKITVLKSKFEAINKDLKILQTKQQYLEQEKKDLLNCFQEVEEEYHQKQGLEEKTYKELQTKISRYQILKDLQKNHEGYFQGVKAILQGKAKGELSCQGICGVVGELLIVPLEYEKAIEVALGGNQQNLVAITDADAERAIKFLKNQNAGRATFLPLNSIQPKTLNLEGQKILHSEGVVGLASDLVRTESSYIKVVQHLLGNIIVVKNLSSGLNLARKSQYSIKVVTLEGEVLNPGGSLTGGSLNKKSSGLLNRSREIKELEVQIKEKKQELQDRKKDNEQYREQITSLRQKTAATEQELQTVNLNFLAAEQNLKHLSQEIQNQKGELELLDFEYVDSQQQLKSYTEELQFVEAKITKLKLNQAQLVQELEKKQSTLKKLKEKNQGYLETITNYKVELASYKQKEENYKNELKEFYAADKELQHLIKARAVEIAEQKMLQQQSQDTINDLRLQSDQLLQNKNEVEKLLKEKLKSKEDLKKVVVALEQENDQQNKTLVEDKERLHSLEVKKTRLEVELENELQRLKENFNLDYAAACLKKIQLSDPKEAQKKVTQLDQEIKNLGTVNTGAIEEYEKLLERFNFLKSQQQDLNEAKVALNKVIDEINTIMANKFQEAFNQIKSSFQNIFFKLFGGGKAELQLTDPDCLLQTGIEIIVQPPGKKLQNLSLLSGGERALTAIALLFAILEVKPSPFCVLDEIEASLDEANVDRFANFLKIFAQQTQFILISHRQGTIEAADALYGVTMEGSGISKLISVALTDKEEKKVFSA
ncbi:chromosome segregation protein SMC [Bacillota bacterium LX-D]|nr:chromosome segregation protein SMC [Bacillota bacterium LX-D]